MLRLVLFLKTFFFLLKISITLIRLTLDFHTWRLFWCIHIPISLVILIRRLLYPRPLSHEYWSHWFGGSQRMVNGGTVKYWACLNLSGCHNKAVDDFCHQLGSVCRRKGMVHSQFFFPCALSLQKYSSLFSHNDLVSVLRAASGDRYLPSSSWKIGGGSAWHPRQEFCQFDSTGWREASPAADNCLAGKGWILWQVIFYDPLRLDLIWSSISYFLLMSLSSLTDPPGLFSRQDQEDLWNWSGYRLPMLPIETRHEIQWSVFGECLAEDQCQGSLSHLLQAPLFPCLFLNLA